MNGAGSESKRGSRCREATAWLKAKCGRGYLSGLSREDAAAWETFVHAVELWALGGASQEHALGAMQCCARAAQARSLHVFRDAVAAVVGWERMGELWPQVGTAVPVLDGNSPPEAREALAPRRLSAGGAGG